MNKLILIGNLTSDPSFRTVNTSTGAVSVCSFTVAVNDRRGGQNDATFFNATAWRGLAETCSKYLSKGRKVYVSGPVSARTYNTNNGQTRVSLDVRAEEVEFLSSKAESGLEDAKADAMNAAKQAAMNVSGSEQTYANMTPVETDDLPF